MSPEKEEFWFEYHAQRLKILEDRARMRESLEQGEQIGIEKGRAEGVLKGQRLGVRKVRLIDRIRSLQGILTLPESTEESLLTDSVESLTRLADDLAEQVRSRHGGN